MLYLRKNVLAVMVLGFASGLPLALTGATLGAWLATENIDLKTIGLFALVGVPYTFKFLWAPLVDQLRMPLMSSLGRRRSWLLVIEIILCILLLITSTLSPQTQIMAIAAVTVLLAFFAATHDIVIDAYRIEILKKEEQGAGAAGVTFGYRMGMIVSGAGALFIADAFGWPAAYISMASLMFIGFLVSLVVGEREYILRPRRSAAEWLKQAVYDPFREFVQRERWYLILLFILFYKLCDAFVLALISPFLIKLGFSLTAIAGVVKTYGIAATIAGVFIGGYMIAKFGIMRSLLICAVLQILSNLVFILQARYGADMQMLYVTVTVEHITSGMATGVFVAYVSALCKIDFTATQYALLSSLAAAPRTIISSSAGFVAEGYGWEIFFIVSAALGIPALILLSFLKEPEVESESVEAAQTPPRATGESV